MYGTMPHVDIKPSDQMPVRHVTRWCKTHTRHVKVSVSHSQSDFSARVRRTKALAKVRSTAKGNPNLPDTTHRRGLSPHMLVKHSYGPMWSG